MTNLQSQEGRTEPVNSIHGLIQFLTATDGGRTSPPRDLGGQYCPHLRVHEEYLGVRIVSDTTEDIRPGIDYRVRLDLRSRRRSP